MPNTSDKKRQNACGSAISSTTGSSVYAATHFLGAARNCNGDSEEHQLQLPAAALQLFHEEFLGKRAILSGDLCLMILPRSEYHKRLYGLKTYTFRVVVHLLEHK